MADLDSSQRQKVILGVLLVSALGYVGYNYAYVPRSQEIDALQSRLTALETQNQTARILTQQNGEPEIQLRLVEFNEQLERVEALVPSSEELPDLLDAISSEAQRTGVEIALIQPVGATAEEFYTRRTYDIAVLGSYHEIGDFLTRVGSLPRIVTPVGLNLRVREETTRNGDPQLEARFSVETFVLPNTTTAEVTDEAE